MARFRIVAPGGLIDVVFTSEQPASAVTVSDTERLLFDANDRCIGYSDPGWLEFELPDRDDWTHAEQMIAEGRSVRREVQIMLAVGSGAVPAGICQAALAEREAPEKRRGAPPKRTAERDHAIRLLYRHLLAEYRADKAPRERALAAVAGSFPLKRKTIERILTAQRVPN